ncbi:MAG: ABC transporter permease [Lentisphaeria bacterium]|nr:ABC transporter permease [Lentisphaeria bacterium]
MKQASDNRAVSRRIDEQVILPWPVAIRITLRGLRIRLGRSLITVSGVVLGIAFLMSVLTGEGLKSGLAEETRTKTEVNRLLKLVEDEIGTFLGRRIGILLDGPVDDPRFLRMLEEIGARMEAASVAVLATRRPGSRAPGPGGSADVFAAPAFRRVENAGAAFRDAHVVLLLSAELPSLAEADLSALLTTMAQPVVLDCFPERYDEQTLRAGNDHVVYSSLSYRQTEEELERASLRHRQQRARQVWITIVSILVTVIGISNAMLMSVTERIREIGTMKCLGALSGFVVKLFLIESFLIGVVGALLGTVLGFLVPLCAYMLSAGMGLLLAGMPLAWLLLCALASVGIGTLLSIIAAIYPAVVAAKMVPADALRTNV